MLMFLAVACGVSAWGDELYFPPQTRNLNTGRFYFHFLSYGRLYKISVGVVVVALLTVTVVSDNGNKSNSGSKRA
jgi:peptidoglycan/LPS O-acetylase OafA/YrhL